MSIREVGYRVGRALFALASRLTPKRTHVVLSGAPNSLEDNVLALARRLPLHHAGGIYWLDGPDPARLGDLGVDTAAVVSVPKRTLRSVRLYLTAKAVLFSHGIYGNARVSRRTTVVNVWHGDGMKKDSSPGWSDYLVASTTTFGNAKADNFHVPRERLLVTGNPRTDLFEDSDRARTRQQFGLEDRPIVLWMPTYRKPIAATPGRTLAGAPSDHPQVGMGMADMCAALDASGFQVVVKAHPLDSTSRGIPQAHQVTSQHLSDANVSLYEFIGCADALISDYSSVWTDYLLLDRPIAFFIPDRLTFASHRGIVPEDALDWLPGPELRTADDALEWGRRMKLEGYSCHEAMRRRSAGWLGLNATQDATGELIGTLASRGLLEIVPDA